VTTHPRPAVDGVSICYIAPDGLHAGLTWLAGNRIYGVGNDHDDIQAIAMAEAVTPYP